MNINNNLFSYSDSQTVLPPMSQPEQANDALPTSSGYYEPAVKEEDALSYCDQFEKDCVQQQQQQQELPKQPPWMSILLNAAQNGSPMAQYGLSLAYRQGNGVEQSYDEALHWCIKAAKGGFKEAQLELPITGIKGIEHSNEKAMEWLTNAAKDGFAYAQYHVGCGYRDGNGLMKSHNRAVIWLREAAKNGYEGAKETLTEIREGLYDSQNAKVMQLLRSAENGSAEAQYNLFLLFCDGNGVEQSYDEALKWCRAAADQGHSKAQLKLPTAFLGGKGIDCSEDAVHPEALEWLKTAARDGFPYAQYHIGCAYRDGRGLERSHDDARRWLQQAAENKYEGAKEALEAM